jgi:hypothetical protein
MTETKEDRLQNVGRNALASLRDMVAALECDYERLAELRDERDGYDAGPNQWLIQWPDDAVALAELEDAADECESREQAEQCIHEDPLSIRVRGEWYEIGDEEKGGEACEFEIFLATGGPAVRILGELSSGEVSRAYLQVQDWGTPWIDYVEPGITEVLEASCGCFYFGD